MFSSSLQSILYEMIIMRRQTLDQIQRCETPVIREMLEESLADLDEAIAELREQGVTNVD